MSDEKAQNAFTILLCVVAGILFVAFGFSIKESLSPFLLIAALLYVLFPFREYEIVRRLLQITATFFLLWFLQSLIGILAPVIVALLFAYILNPLVSALARKMPRWSAALLVTTGAVGVIAGVVLFVLPLVVSQLEGLIGIAGELAQNTLDWIKSGRMFELLAQFGIPIDEARNFITRELSPKLQSILDGLFSGVFGFVTGFASLILQIINIVIIPFLFFYIVKDFPTIRQALINLLPENAREQSGRLLATIDDILGQYVRGAIIVALIQGTISAIVLAFIGVDYPLVLGIMTAVLNFIPYVGLITSLIVSCIVAVFSGEPILAKVIGVAVLYLSQKLLEATVFGPKIVGSKVGLHPVVLILSLLIFGYFLGFVGMLIAVPASALVIAFYKEWLAKSEIPSSPPIATGE